MRKMLKENGNETLLYDSINLGISLENSKKSKKNRYLKIFLFSILLIILLF